MSYMHYDRKILEHGTKRSRKRMSIIFAFKLETKTKPNIDCKTCFKKNCKIRQ